MHDVESFRGQGGKRLSLKIALSIAENRSHSAVKVVIALARASATRDIIVGRPCGEFVFLDIFRRGNKTPANVICFRRLTERYQEKRTLALARAQAPYLTRRYTYSLKGMRWRARKRM